MQSTARITICIIIAIFIINMLIIESYSESYVVPEEGSMYFGQYKYVLKIDKGITPKTAELKIYPPKMESNDKFVQEGFFSKKFTPNVKDGQLVYQMTWDDHATILTKKEFFGKYRPESLIGRNWRYQFILDNNDTEKRIFYDGPKINLFYTNPIWTEDDIIYFDTFAYEGDLTIFLQYLANDEFTISSVDVKDEYAAKWHDKTVFYLYENDKISYEDWITGMSQLALITKKGG